MLDSVTVVISAKQQDVNYSSMAEEVRYGLVCSRSQSSQEEDDQVRAQKSRLFTLFHLLLIGFIFI